MNPIDEIKPSEDTLMTDELIRIFKSAGCSPTGCHACEKEIKSGEIFKLVPHIRIRPGCSTSEEFIDEMCCDSCGSHQLTLRDRREMREYKNSKARKMAAGGHGFSRPSKEKVRDEE